MGQGLNLVILSGSKFVCDSLKLAEYLGTRHDNLLDSLKRAAKAAQLFGNDLAYKAVEYTDSHGQRRPKFDLTFENLIDVSTYIEKLRPKLREYLKAVRDAETKQLAHLKAQLEAVNQKLLEPKSTKPRSPRSSHVALAEKKIAILEESEGEFNLVSVLASSLTRVELARAIVAARDAQAKGSIKQAELGHTWLSDVELWDRLGCRDEPCPSPLDYMNSCEYAGFFNNEDDEE